MPPENVNAGAARQAGAEARAANAEIRAANAGLAEMKTRAVGLAGDLVTPMVLLARGATMTQAAFQGVKTAIVGRVLGPIGAVSGAALGLLGTIKVLTSVFGRAGVESRASLEKMEKGFQPLLKSATAARQRVKELVDFSKNTPFRLESIAAANKSLQYLTRGALSTKEGMRLVGDAAAASGTDFEETAFSVGKLYEAIQAGEPVQRASMRLEWMGMISAGTAQKLDALQQSGADSTEIWKQMERELARNSGGMAQMSQTLDGMRSSLATTQQVASAGFGKGFMEGEKATLAATRAAVENLTPAFETLGAILGVIPNAIARVKAFFVEFIGASKLGALVFLGAAQALGILLLTIVALQGVQIGRVIMGFIGFGRAVGAAKDAATALTSIRLLLTQATHALATGEIRLALVTLKAAAAQSLAALQTNGLAAVTGVLFNGLKMVAGLIGNVVRGAFAALATTAGLLIASLLTVITVAWHYKRALDAETDSVNASREATVAHTAALEDQVRAMMTVEDATRARASALQELLAAEEAARAARPENTSLGDQVMRNVFDIGEKAQLAAEDRVNVARKNLSKVDALDPSKFGTDEDTRQKNRQLAQDRQGAHFYKGVTEEMAQSEEDSKFSSRATLQGWGEEGKKLNGLNQWRAELRADPREDGKADALAKVNAEIGAERKRIMESSGSAEVRANAKLAEDDEKVDAHKRAGQARVMAEKVEGASAGWFADKGRTRALAAETDDPELKRALGLGSKGENVSVDRTAARARAAALAASAAAEAEAAGPTMDPSQRQKAMDAVNDEQKRYDKAAVRQQKLADQEAGYEAQRAVGEEKLAALRDDGFDAAMAELRARGEALDLEEKITAEKLAQKLISDKEAAAATAQTAAQRAALEAQKRMQTAQTERDTKRASLTMKASAMETRAQDLRRRGEHEAAKAVEIQAEQNQLAAKRIELEQSAKDMDEGTLRGQGFTGADAAAVRADYVNQGIAGEQEKLDQERRFSEEDKALTRRRAGADQGVSEGEMQGKVLRLGGNTRAAKQTEEAARRQSDEVRREELRRQNIGTGMTDEEARGLADRQIKTEQAGRALDLLGSGVGTTVASSMASIGGGGGVAGVDAMVNRQEIANRLLKEIADTTKKKVTNVADNRMG